MVVSRRMMEAYLAFVNAAHAGTWDDEVVELDDAEWETMGDVLAHRCNEYSYKWFDDLEYKAQHSIRLEIRRSGT